LLLRQKNPGLTASIIDGIMSAETLFFIVMDSDFQHPPEKLPEIYSMLENGPDLVVACRSEVKEWPAHRKLLSLGASFLSNLRLAISGCPSASDVLSGYFGARKGWAAASISSSPGRFEPSGYKFLFELLKGEKKVGIRIAEIPYIFNGRLRGKSKIGLSHVLSHSRSLLK